MLDFLNFNRENSYLLYGVIGLAVLSLLTFIYFQFTSSFPSKIERNITQTQHNNEIYGMEETAHYENEVNQDPTYESRTVEDSNPEPITCDDGKCFI